MQFIKTAISRLIFIFPVVSFAQSTRLPLGTKHEPLLDRLEILFQDNAELNLSTTRPLSRKLAVEAAELADSMDKKYPYDYFYHLSPVDRYNIHPLRMDNSEWATGDQSGFASKKSWINTFYKTKSNFFEVNDKDFFLAINPVVQQQQSVASGNSERVFLNAKGLTGRGMISRKLGFDFYVTDNQERGPQFVQDWITRSTAVPGAGFYKSFKKTAVDYFDGRGSIFFNAGKYFNFQFGYDKNFIGSGYRSLFLSDFSNSYLFFKINTRIWKLDYENIFMELTNQYIKGGGDNLLPKKYAVIHHIGVNATRWLNLGLFENVTFARKDHFDFSYLNPVMFLRVAEQQNGSPDKAGVGLDFKMNIGHATQLYGQLLFNEFMLKEIRHYKNGWWGNKQALQLGAKYINAFRVNNLDLQAELNIVRPFTYAHNDSVSNYTHYNQPLAHPLGANFDELVLLARYQPHPKWWLQARMIYYRQGLDSAGLNFGSNIFADYKTRPRDYGFKVGSGIPVNCVNAALTASYEIRENIFFDLSAMVRRYTVSQDNSLSNNTTILTIGLRMNAFRREYNY